MIDEIFLSRKMQNWKCESQLKIKQIESFNMPSCQVPSVLYQDDKHVKFANFSFV